MGKILKKIKVKKKVFFVIVLILLFVFASFWYLKDIVNPIIIEMSTAKVRALSQRCVETVAYEVIKESNVYDNLIRIYRDEDGNITSMNTNSAEINILARDLSQRSQKKLEELGALGVQIPIGSLTGLPIFTGKGPKVSIKLVPIGTVNCSFKSEFSSAGINQTNHRIYLTANTNVSVIMPTANKKVSTKTEILITESIIVGKIPDVYVNSKADTDYLDLVP